MSCCHCDVYMANRYGRTYWLNRTSFCIDLINQGRRIPPILNLTFVFSLQTWRALFSPSFWTLHFAYLSQKFKFLFTFFLFSKYDHFEIWKKTELSEFSIRISKIKTAFQARRKFSTTFFAYISFLPKMTCSKNDRFCPKL